MTLICQFPPLITSRHCNSDSSADMATSIAATLIHAVEGLLSVLLATGEFCVYVLLCSILSLFASFITHSLGYVLACLLLGLLLRHEVKSEWPKVALFDFSSLASLAAFFGTLWLGWDDSNADPRAFAALMWTAFLTVKRLWVLILGGLWVIHIVAYSVRNRGRCPDLLKVAARESGARNCERPGHAD